MSYSAEVLADSPNAYFRLGDLSGTICTATVGVDLAYFNTPTLAITGALSGDSDTAVSFAAASLERVKHSAEAHQTFQDVGDVFTIEAWIKRASTGAAMSIVFNGNDSIDLEMTAGDLLQLDRAAVLAIVSSTVTITDTSSWHHVVATKNGATVKLYIDGADRTGSVTNSTFTNPTQFFEIAHGNQGYFDGGIDEVALYPTALSAARVAAHYAAAFPVVSPLPLLIPSPVRW